MVKNQKLNDNDISIIMKKIEKKIAKITKELDRNTYFVLTIKKRKIKIKFHNGERTYIKRKEKIKGYGNEVLYA